VLKILILFDFITLTVSGTAQTTNNKFEKCTPLGSLFQKESMAFISQLISLG